MLIDSPRLHVAVCVLQDAWMAVYDSAVEAIFLCYLVDQEENGGDVHSYYASKRLRGYMEDHKPSLILPTSNPGSRADSEHPELQALESSPKRE